jgi:hypothetical protein
MTTTSLLEDNVLLRVNVTTDLATQENEVEVDVDLLPKIGDWVVIRKERLEKEEFYRFRIGLVKEMKEDANDSTTSLLVLECGGKEQNGCEEHCTVEKKYMRWNKSFDPPDYNTMQTNLFLISDSDSDSDLEGSKRKKSSLKEKYAEFDIGHLVWGKREELMNMGFGLKRSVLASMHCTGYKKWKIANDFEEWMLMTSKEKKASDDEDRIVNTAARASMMERKRKQKVKHEKNQMKKKRKMEKMDAGNC